MCYLANVELTISFVEGEKKQKTEYGTGRSELCANTENKYTGCIACVFTIPLTLTGVCYIYELCGGGGGGGGVCVYICVCPSVQIVALAWYLCVTAVRWWRAASLL